MTDLHLYCHVCHKHTPHRHQVAQFATQCTICNTITGQLERSHVESLHYTTPDGVEASVVHHTPDTVTFFIPSGEHAGYLNYDKHRGRWTDENGKLLAV